MNVDTSENAFKAALPETVEDVIVDSTNDKTADSNIENDVIEDVSLQEANLMGGPGLENEVGDDEKARQDSETALPPITRRGDSDSAVRTPDGPDGHQKRPGRETSQDGETRSKGVATYESVAHAVFKDEYEEILQREIEKISSKIQDRLQARKSEGLSEDEQALQQLKFEKVYGMPAIRVNTVPRKEWLLRHSTPFSAPSSDLRQSSSHSMRKALLEDTRSRMKLEHASHVYSFGAMTSLGEQQRAMTAKQRSLKQLEPLSPIVKGSERSLTEALEDEGIHQALLEPPRSESVPLLKREWNSEFNSKTLEDNAQPAPRRHFERVQPRRLPPTPFGARAKEEVQQALRVGELFPRRVAHSILIALKREMEHRKEQAAGYPKSDDDDDGMTEDEETLLYEAFNLQETSYSDFASNVPSDDEGGEEGGDALKEKKQKRLVSIEHHTHRSGSISKGCFLALLQGMGVIKPPVSVHSSLETSLAEDLAPLSLKELLVAGGRDASEAPVEDTLIKHGQSSQTHLLPLSRLRAAKLVIDTRNFQKDHGGVLWMLQRLTWDDFLSSVGSIALEAVVTRGWASVQAGTQQEDAEVPEVEEKTTDQVQREAIQKKPAEGLLNWKTGISWTDYQPTHAEMEEVKSIFRQFGREDHGTLADIKSALLLNGFSFSAVTAIMQQAALLVDKPSGRIAILPFARVLLKYRAEAMIRTQPPGGMPNVIRLLVVRGGNRALVMPAISMLQDKVLPRLVNTATQLGGTLVVEHLSLADHPKYWHARERPAAASVDSGGNGADSAELESEKPPSKGRKPRGSIVDIISALPAVMRSPIKSHLRITADQVVEYAKHCKTQAGSVWFLFVMDDSVTEACLPTRVSQDQLQRVRAAVEHFPNATDIQILLGACYTCDSRDLNEDHGLALDKEDELVSLHKLLVEAVVGEGIFAGIGRHGRDRDVLEARSTIAQFLQTAHAFQALEKAPEVAPVFAVMRESALDSKDAEESSELDERIAEMPLANVFRYKVLNETKNKPNHRTNKRFWSVAQALSACKNINPNATRRKSAAYDILATVELAKSKQKEGAGAAAGAGAANVGHHLTAKRWLQLVEHDVHDTLFSVVAKTITDAPYMSEEKLHENELKALLYEAEDDQVELHHESQQSVIDGVVTYLHHDILIGFRAVHQEEEMTEPLHVKVKTYLDAFRKAVAHDAFCETWHFPHDKDQEERALKSQQRARSPSPDRGRHSKEAKVILDVFKAQAEFCCFDLGMRQTAYFTLGKDWTTLSWPERLAVVQTIDHLHRTQGLDIEQHVESAVQTAEDPWSSVERDAPLLIVGEAGSGRSTAIALALKKAASLGQLLMDGQDEGGFKPADGKVSGLTFLRILGATAASLNGRYMLRSLVVQMREALSPDSHLQAAVPSTLFGLELEMLSLMVMASTHSPLVIVVDGIEKLPLSDPVRSMLWIPKVLPPHVRLIVSATTEFYTPQVLQRFQTHNIVHLGTLSVPAAQHYLVDTLHTAKRTAEGEDLSLISEAYELAPSVGLLRIYASYAKLWNSCNQSVTMSGRLPIAANASGNLALNADFFSPMGHTCLSLLALSRHGLSDVLLESAMSLIILRADDKPPRPESPAQTRRSIVGKLRSMLAAGTPWQVLFHTEMMVIRPLTNVVVHGKGVVLRIASEVVKQAVRDSVFFLEHRALLSETLMSVLCDQHLKALPLYQQVAELPAAQIQFAEITGRMPDDGHSAIRETLCNLSFLKVKVEVGLLEDLLLDFQEFFAKVAADEIAVSSITLKSTRAFLDMMMRNMHILVKPFHAHLLAQLWTAHTCDKETIQPATGKRWATAEDEETTPQCYMTKLTDFDVRVECIARISAKDSILCCTSASGPSFATFACGLKNGRAVVYDGLTFDKTNKWVAHETSITAIAFVQDWKYGQTRNSSGTPILLLTASKKGYIKAWQCGPYTQVFYFAPFLQAAGESAFPTATSEIEAEVFNGLEQRMAKTSLETLKKDRTAKIDEMMAGDFKNSIPCIAVSRAIEDHYFIAIGSSTGRVMLWRCSLDDDTCVSLPALEGHQAAVNSVCFHDDKPWLVTASSDRTARLWDCGEDPVEFLQDMQNGAPTYWSSFRGDSLICSGTGFIREWQLQAKQPEEPTLGRPPAGAMKGTKKVNLVKLGSMRLQVSPVLEGGRSPPGRAGKRASKAATVDRLKRINSFVLKNMSGGQGIHESLRKGAASGANAANMIDMRAITTKHCAVFKNKGYLMAFCDLKLYCWDLSNDTAQSIPMFSHITACAATHDGRILTASQDNTLRVWTLNDVARKNQKVPSPLGGSSPLASLLGPASPSKSLPRPTRKHKGQVHGRILRPQLGVEDEPSFAPGPASGPTADEVGLLQSTGVHPLPVENLTMSHDGKCCLTVGGGDAYIWDTPTGLLRGTFGEGSEFGTVSCATFSPLLPSDHPLASSDTHLLFVAWSTYRVNLWDIANVSSPILEIGTHLFHIRKIKVDNEGRFVATASMDKTVKVWNIWNNPKRHVVRLEDVEKEVPLKDGKAKKLVAILQSRGVASSVASRMRSRTLLEGLHQDSVLDIALCPIGTRVASASADHTVAVWSLEALGQGERMWVGNHGSFVQAVAFSPPTGKLLASAGGDRMCRIWDVERGVKIHLLKTTGALTLVQFSPSGAMVAAGGLRGALGVWNVTDGKEVKGKMHPSMCDNSCDVSSLNWSPDSRAVLVSGTDGEMFAWDVQVGRFLAGFSCNAVNSEDTQTSRFGGSFGEHFEDSGISCAAVHFSPSFPTKPLSLASSEEYGKSRKGSIIAAAPGKLRLSKEMLASTVGPTRGIARELSSTSTNSQPSNIIPKSMSAHTPFRKHRNEEASLQSVMNRFLSTTSSSAASDTSRHGLGVRLQSSELRRVQSSDSNVSSADSDADDPSDAAHSFRRSFGESTSTICVCGDNKGRVHILMSNGLETTPKDYDRRDGPHMHFKLHHVTHHVEQLHAFDAATVVRRAKESDHAKFIMGATERHAAIRAESGQTTGGIEYERGREVEKTEGAIKLREDAEARVLHILSQHKGESVVFGWLWKLNSLCSGEAEEHWRDRLCVSVEGQFKYISEKEQGKEVVICNFKSVERLDLTSFKCPGREFAFTLRFFDGSDITFAADSDEERERWTTEIVRVLEDADEEAEERSEQARRDEARARSAHSDDSVTEAPSGASSGRVAGMQKQVSFLAGATKTPSAEDSNRRRSSGGDGEACLSRPPSDDAFVEVRAEQMTIRETMEAGAGGDIAAMLSLVEELNEQRAGEGDSEEGTAADRQEEGGEDEQRDHAEMEGERSAGAAAVESEEARENKTIIEEEEPEPDEGAGEDSVS